MPAGSSRTAVPVCGEQQQQQQQQEALPEQAQQQPTGWIFAAWVAACERELDHDTITFAKVRNSLSWI